jgi:hypothetical protein
MVSAEAFDPALIAARVVASVVGVYSAILIFIVATVVFFEFFSC